MELELGNCRIVIDEKRQLITTIFEDGVELVAAPNYGHDDIALAHKLGYNGDTWSMSRDHELLHTILAVAAGLSFSPVLWTVAHPDEQPPRMTADEMRFEEGRVLEAQRVMNSEG